MKVVPKSVGNEASRSAEQIRTIFDKIPHNSGQHPRNPAAAAAAARLGQSERILKTRF